MAKRCVLTEVAIDDPKFAPILPVLFPQGDPADPQQARDKRVLAHALSNNSVHTRIPVQADFDGRLSSYPVIDAAVYRDGQIYIISLPGESFVGPLALPEVVAHKLGNRVVPILREIEMSRDNMSLLPPKKPSPPAD